MSFGPSILITGDQLATLGLLLIATAAGGAIVSLLRWVKRQAHEARVRRITQEAKTKRAYERAQERIGLGRRFRYHGYKGPEGV